MKISVPLLLAQAAVVAAVGLQVAFGFRVEPTVRPPDLEAGVPAQLAGWEVKNDPLGSSPEAIAIVGQILNFDQAVQRVYTQGPRQFTIFAAYWNRGKMPARAIAVHTPDCCWSRSGYTCTVAKFRQVLPVADAKLPPAERRTFNSPTGEPTHALFWLLAGGEPFDFGDRFDGAGELCLTGKALVRDAVLGCREAIFVTVSANVSFEELFADRGFQSALQQLAQGGLKVSSPVAPGS